MKKLFLLTAVVGLFAFTGVNAQTKNPSLGIGAEFGFPLGKFGDVFSWGYGGAVMYQYPVASNLNITGSAGYTIFKTKSGMSASYSTIINNGYGYTTTTTTSTSGGGYNTAGFIPVKVGARYFFDENFFVGGELGASFSTKSGSGYSTAFVYSPGVGVSFPVSDKGAVELGGRYEGWAYSGHTSNFIGLRLAYNFGL